MDKKTLQLTLCACFMAMGAVVPVFFHQIGLGKAFMPMFWPMAAAGFFITPVLGLWVGLLTPVLSMLLTGMPPVPVLYKMMMELAVLVSVTAMIKKYRSPGVFWNLLIGMIAGLSAGLAGSFLLARIWGLPPAFYAAASMAGALPGIILILIFLPLIISRIIKKPIFKDK